MRRGGNREVNERKKFRQRRTETIRSALFHLWQSPTVVGFFIGLSSVYISYHREETMWLLIPAVYVVATFYRIVFEVLLMIHVVQHKRGLWTWWHKVCDGVYLGSIPLEGLGHRESLVRDLRVTRVLAINNDFELVARTIIGSPVHPSAWKKEDVSFEQIVSDDFIPPTFDKLHRGADIIHQTVSETGAGGDGGRIYVHCKSGIGRSASLVIAYLVKHKGMTVVDAHKLVKGVRPQIIGRRSRQYANLLDFEKDYRGDKL